MMETKHLDRQRGPEFLHRF